MVIAIVLPTWWVDWNTKFTISLKLKYFVGRGIQLKLVSWLPCGMGPRILTKLALVTFKSLGMYIQLTFGKESKKKQESFKQNHPQSFSELTFLKVLTQNRSSHKYQRHWSLIAIRTESFFFCNMGNNMHLIPMDPWLGQAWVGQRIWEGTDSWPIQRLRVQSPEDKPE